MSFEVIRQVMFQPAPEGTPVADAVRLAGPARRLRDSFEPLAMHAVWSKVVHDRLAEFGLDFFTGYVWGRAAPMGNPAGALVASAFAAFEPAVIVGRYDAARAAVDQATVWAAVVESCGISLREVLGDAAPEADIASAADRLGRAVESVDSAGRPLFAAVQATPWPADAYARLWQATLALREHRGDSHVAAYVAAGFDPVQMNILTELWLHYPLGAYSGSRAWSADRTEAVLASLRSGGLLDGDSLTPAGAAARSAVEDATDRAQDCVVDVLGDDLEPLCRQLDAWSAICVAAGAFPPDFRKRAAG